MIRVFRETDRDAVVALWNACDLVVPWNVPEDDIAHKLAFQPDLFFVVERGGEVVGSVMAGYEGHRGQINYLAVRPDLQGSGLGRELMEFAENRLRELAALQRAGLGLGVVSTKFRYRIEQILVREGLRGRFGCVIGGEDVTRHKPDPEALERALDALRVARGQVVYVGDSLVDAEASERASIRFVAVLSGVTPREAFAAHPAEAVIPSVCELPAWLGMAA